MTFMRPQHTTWLPDVSALTYNGCTQTWWNHTFIRAVHRLFTVPRFPWDLRCWLVSLTFCHIGFWTQVYWGEYKMPLGRVVEGPSPLHYSTTPPPILTGILYSPYFCSHQETKMAASQTQQSQPTISRLHTGGCQVTRGHFKKWLKVITFGHKYWPAALSSKPCWWQI